ncbi:AB-hydrolase YheT [Clavulina sp. PMI_390]|nr:AB-hydrolase YheT [Clavulina sp. PMI_390]
MGAFFSILSWLFSDPRGANRGAPFLYLPTTPAFLARKTTEKSGGPGDPTCTGTEVSLAEFLTERCPSFMKPYVPTWWLPNGHFQTIWCALGDFEKDDIVPYKRTLLTVPDGGQMGLDWAEPEGEDLPANTPIIVVLHGLTGGSYEPYVRTVLSVACKSKSEGGLGYRACVMNFRGCAGVELLTAQHFSGGYTGDIRTALLYISGLYPDAPLLGIGFSLGANVLTLLVNEDGEDCRLTSACVMACPWDNVKNSDKLEKRWINHAIYSKAMGGTLIALFNRGAAKIATFDNPSAITPHLAALMAMKNPDFIDVNRHFTSIMGGSSPPFPFPTVEAYYKWSSADKSLDKIRIPFLALNALDDPIVAEIPLQEAGKNPMVGFVVTEKGGHLGWFVGGGFLGRGAPIKKWHVQPLCEWFQAITSDYVESRPNKNRGKARFVNEEGFTMEEGSGPFVGFKVKSVGVPVVDSGPASGQVKGL